MSVIGSGLTGSALGVWVYQTTGSVKKMALTQLSFWLPIVLGSPIAGALVDRWDRRRGMILCECGAAVCTLSLALLMMAGRLAVWHIFAAMFVNPFLNILQRLARAGATPLLVPRSSWAAPTAWRRGLTLPGNWSRRCWWARW